MIARYNRRAMLAYIIRRILYMIPTIFGVTLVTFIIVCMTPGNPGPLAAGGTMRNISPEALRAMRSELGLDLPIHVRYARWVSHLVRLDFGTSFVDRRPVTERIRERLWPTLYLEASAFAVVLLIAVPLGLVAAVRQHSWFDKISGAVLYALYSLPDFWVALVLILWVAVWNKWLPFLGAVSDDYAQLSQLGQIKDRLAHLVLPAICIAYPTLAYIARFTRGITLEVIRQDYVRTARAKGVPERTVIFRHIFRNTLIPLVTLIALNLGALLSGSIVVERIFQWPGTGKLFYDAVLQRDLPTIMGLTTISAGLILLFTLIADILYAVADPRVSYR